MPNHEIFALRYGWHPEGHSDADCLTHALADAILGALGLPDIGHFFPNDDPSIAGIDSQEILKKAVQEAHNQGYHIVNVDIALIAEEPKIYPHIDQMKAVLSKNLEVGSDCVGIKATTNEKIGDIGRGAGIAAQAVCLLSKATD